MIQNLPAVKDECGLGHGGVDAGVVQAHKLVPLSAHHHRVRCKQKYFILPQKYPRIIVATSGSRSVGVCVAGDEGVDGGVARAGGAGGRLGQLHHHLLPRHLRVVDGEVRALVQQVLRDVDGGRLTCVAYKVELRF